MKRACNNISATKPRVLTAMMFITGFLFCVNTSHAQEAEPYWSITIKHTKYKIQNKLDTICLKTKQLKQAVLVTYTSVGEKETSSKKIIIVMTTTRQELGRYAMSNSKVSIPLDSLTIGVTDRIVSLNVVQQPANGLLAKRARVGTKLLCYIKW